VEKARAHLIISGFVQGVFFRAHTQDKALELGLEGWVRNRYDGTVEAVFEGEKDKVEEMIGWCQRGPSGARVSGVSVDWEDYKGEFRGFDILYGY
jgi:acylphosphatase